MSSISISALSIFEPACLTFGPFKRRTYSGSNTACIGLMALSGSRTFSSSGGFQHRGMHRRLVRRVVKNIPAAKNQIVQAGQWNKILDHRAAAFGAFPEAHSAKLCERTNGLAETAFHRFNSRHERGADRSNAGNQDAHLTFRGRNPGISYGGQLRISLSAHEDAQMYPRTGLPTPILRYCNILCPR